jgi:hypothetical protein
MNLLRNLLTFTFSLILLTACGGGGGGGGTPTDQNQSSKAVIDVKNEEKLATAATEGVIQSYKEAILNQKTLKELIGTETCATGSITDNYNASTGAGTISYSLCDTSSFIYNGSVSITATKSGDIGYWRLNYGSFSIDSISERMVATCETTISTDTTHCTYSATSTGLDSRSYDISNAEIAGTLLSGYTISATIEDPDYGEISITTESPVYIFSCSEQQPSSGEIKFTDGDSKVISIIFDSCSGYTVSYSGVSNSYSW